MTLENGSSSYDLFRESRREMLLQMEQSERRRRLYKKFGADKKKSLTQNTWSVEDHRDYLMIGYSDKQLNWRVMERRMLTFPAFWELSGIETKVLLMCCNEVSWKPAKKKQVKAKAGNGRCRTIELPREPMAFYLPLSRLEAVGISRKAAKSALKRLQELGFIKKIELSAGMPTLYELSDRYQELSSQELGGVKKNPPSEREKTVSGDSEHSKPFIRAIK